MNLSVGDREKYQDNIKICCFFFKYHKKKITND